MSPPRTNIQVQIWHEVFYVQKKAWYKIAKRNRRIVRDCTCLFVQDGIVRKGWCWLVMVALFWKRPGEQGQCCSCCSRIPPTFNEPKLDLRNVPEVHLAISQRRLLGPDFYLLFSINWLRPVLTVPHDTKDFVKQEKSCSSLHCRVCHRTYQYSPYVALCFK